MQFHSNSEVIALSHAVQSPQSPHCHVKELKVSMCTCSHDEHILPESEVELLQAVANNESLRILEYDILNPSHDVFAALALLIKYHTTLSEVVVLGPSALNVLYY